MERRLTAILAADVVGYSRLMESNEMGTFARFKELREHSLFRRLQTTTGEWSS